MASADDETLYVNVHVGGIVRSTDGGMTWTDTLDIHSDVHQVITDPDRPRHAYAATARGFAVTTDGADTWGFIDEGLDSSYCPGDRHLDGIRVYLGLARARRSQVGRVPEIAWGRHLPALHQGPTRLVQHQRRHVLPGRTDQLVVAGDADGTVYESLDDGDTCR